MTDRTVCEIKPLLYLHLLLGNYHDLHPSHGIRLLIKLYCLFVFAIFTMIYYYFKGIYPWHMIMISYLEYASLVFFSLYFNDKHVLDYYQYMPYVDVTPISKNFISLSRIFNIYIPVIYITDFMLNGIFNYIFLGSDTNNINLVIITTCVGIATQFRRLPALLPFLLSYYRVRIIRETLGKTSFDNTPRRRFRPQKCIQMYDTLMDAIETSDFFVKTRCFIISIGLMLLTIGKIYVILNQIQKHTFSYKSVLWITLAHIMETRFLIISAVLQDLIKDNLKKIKIIIIEKRISSTNERERAEIQKLYQVMQKRPYEYALARIVPLNVRSLLSFCSYITTTIIAILQIKRLVD